MRNIIKSYIRLIATLLLLVYVLGFFRIYLPYLEYRINYKFITTELCINQNNKEIDCNGNCYLNKQLEKAAKNDSQSQSLSQKIVDNIETINPTFGMAFVNGYITVDSNFYKIIDQILSSSLENTPPPPKA